MSLPPCSLSSSFTTESSHGPRDHQVDKKVQIQKDALPVDIILRIAHHLVDEEHVGTLSAVQRCSRDLYITLSPLLYRRVDIRRTRSDSLLTLDASLASLTADLDIKVEEAVRSGQLFSSSNATLRRLDALRHIRRLTLFQLPSDPISTSFLTFITKSSALLLPNLESVQILPDAVDSIRTFIPGSYDRVRNPPFLEGLSKTSRPSRLCIAHRVVPSEEWEEHREISVLGQYQVVARLTQLRDDDDGGLWSSSLREFSVHDIVHQVLPSLQGCRNVYHFSSHLSSPSNKFLSPGPRSTYIPGPPWSYRAWQLGTAIKNLFPSGSDGKTVLKGTSWEFVNYDGHILTKMVRDDDDDSGVGYDEVQDLVQDAVKAGLPQDLPMREGFGRELVGEVFDKIGYVAGDRKCACCASEWKDSDFLAESETTGPPSLESVTSPDIATSVDHTTPRIIPLVSVLMRNPNQFRGEYGLVRSSWDPDLDLWVV